MSRPKCPHCGDQLVLPAGPEDAEILLIGEFPGYNEIVRGYPFVSGVRNKTTAGDVLKKELARVGVQMFACRATNLWQHEKDEKGCDVNWHIDTAMKEVAHRKIVVCLGSDVSKVLFKTNIMDVAGLVLKHDGWPGVKFLMSPNPAMALHAPLGEIRDALAALPTLMEEE